MKRRDQGRSGARRRARECALQALYQLETRRQAGETVDAEGALRAFWGHFPLEDDGPEEVEEFTRSLVLGVDAHQAEVDRLIQRYSQHWRLERMARVDRNVLRLAIFELLHLPEVPRRVTLNEAIELAKKFGTEESGAFVNGILDRAAQDVRKP